MNQVHEQRARLVHPLELPADAIVRAQLDFTDVFAALRSLINRRGTPALWGEFAACFEDDLKTKAKVAPKTVTIDTRPLGHGVWSFSVNGTTYATLVPGIDSYVVRYKFDGFAPQSFTAQTEGQAIEMITAILNWKLTK